MADRGHDPHAGAARLRRTAVRLAYAGVIAVATLRGLQAVGDFDAAGARLWRAFHPRLRAADLVDAARNMALFGGFGAVWLASSGTRRLRRAVVRATAAGVLLSAAVEAAQLFSPKRMASVLDVLTNGTGAWVGAAGVATAIAALARSRRRAPLGPAPLVVAALPYVLACAVEICAPLGRPDRVADAVGGRLPEQVTAVVARYQQQAGALPPAAELVLFVPAGFLATLWLAERGARPGRAAYGAALALGVVWAAAELARTPLRAEVRPLAVALHAMASAAGALAAGVLVERLGRRRLGGWLARWGGAAIAATDLLWSLRPFRFEASLGAVAAKLRATSLRPLESLFTRQDVYSVADVAVGFLLYAPLGGWLAARARGAEADGGRVAGVGVGILAAAVGELVQAGVRGRAVDVTDGLVQGAGVLIGWAAVKRAARRRAEWRDVRA